MSRRTNLIFAKLDPGFYENRKIIRAGRNGREVFQLALCMNAQRGALGILPAGDLELTYIAYRLRITEDEAQDGIKRAIEADLLAVTQDGYEIRGWDEDWSRRGATRAEIQANYRDRQEGKPERYIKQVTREVTGNALPIRVDQSRSERGDGNALSLGSSGSDQGARKPQPLSSTWEPAAATVAVVKTLDVDYAHELAQFRLNAAARGHLFGDPDAAFEKFARGSRDTGKKPKQKAGARTSTPKPLRVRAEDGTWLEDDGNGGMRRSE